MQITIDFKHEEDFKRTMRLIRKAGRLEQEGRKLGDAEIGLIHSALMRSDIIMPCSAQNLALEFLHRGEDAKVSNQLYQ